MDQSPTNLSGADARERRRLYPSSGSDRDDRQMSLVGNGTDVGNFLTNNGSRSAMKRLATGFWPIPGKLWALQVGRLIHGDSGGLERTVYKIPSRL